MEIVHWPLVVTLTMVHILFCTCGDIHDAIEAITISHVLSRSRLMPPIPIQAQFTPPSIPNLEKATLHVMPTSTPHPSQPPNQDAMAMTIPRTRLHRTTTVQLRIYSMSSPCRVKIWSCNRLTAETTSGLESLESATFSIDFFRRALFHGRRRMPKIAWRLYRLLLASGGCRSAAMKDSDK